MAATSSSSAKGKQQHWHTVSSSRGTRVRQPAACSSSDKPTLDLHGFKRDDAIRRVTDFLEEQSSRSLSQLEASSRTSGHIRRGGSRDSSPSFWVRVITGSGSHSPDGPVLRQAVQELLTKRQMTFTISKGRGSFIVDANSGIVMRPAPIVDSKLVVVPYTDDSATAYADAVAVSRTDEIWIDGHQEQHCRKDATINPRREVLMHHVLPQHSSLCLENDEEVLRRVRQQSQHEQRLHQRKLYQHQQEVAQMLSDSKLEYERDVMIRQADLEMFQKTLSQSTTSGCCVIVDVEQQEEVHQKDRDDEENHQLREVLAQSAAEVELQQIQHQLQQEVEEALLNEILLKSKSETCLMDIISPVDAEEEELRLALEQSLREV